MKRRAYIKRPRAPYVDRTMKPTEFASVGVICSDRDGLDVDLSLEMGPNGWWSIVRRPYGTRLGITVAAGQVASVTPARSALVEMSATVTFTVDLDTGVVVDAFVLTPLDDAALMDRVDAIEFRPPIPIGTPSVDQRVDQRLLDARHLALLALGDRLWPTPRWES